MWHHVNPNSGSKGKRERRRGLNENDHLPHGKTEEQIRGGLPRRGDAHRHLRARRWLEGRGETKRETRGVYSPSQLRRRRCREVPPRRWDESSDSDTGGGAVEYVRGRELDGEVKYERGRARWSTREGGSRWVSRARRVGCLSYGPPWAHYPGGYQDRLLGGPLGLPGLRYTASEGVEQKDYTGVVLG
jgi:hypothetical protein